MSHFARPALALGAGALVASSMPPWGWWPAAFAGIAVFSLAVDGASSRRGAFGLGWLFGVGWMAPAMAWMWFLTAPGYVLVVAFFAALHGVAAAWSPRGRATPIGRAAAHTLAEVLRLVMPFGGVPLATLAIGQAAGPLASLARVGGVVLLTWVTFQLGFALGALLRRPRPAGVVPAAAFSVGFVALCVTLATEIAPRGEDTGEIWRVAAVQGGGPQGTHAIDTDARVVFERHLTATAAIEADPELDLVVWPENAIDIDGLGTSFATSDELADIAEQAARLGVPIAVGITEDVDDEHFTNAQVVVSPEGEVTSRYDKVRRVPFGEYVPLRGLLEALGAPLDQVPNDARAGTGPAVIEVHGNPVGVAISWEIFFGGRVREGVHHGGQLVLNPTNGASYTLTVLQSQQVASSRLRAIESARTVVQVSPTGFSAFVSPAGEVSQRTAVSERAVIVADVALRSGRTWYSRLGDRPFVALVALVLAASWWVARRATPG